MAVVDPVPSQVSGPTSQDLPGPHLATPARPPHTHLTLFDHAIQLQADSAHKITICQLSVAAVKAASQQ